MHSRDKSKESLVNTMQGAAETTGGHSEACHEGLWSQVEKVIRNKEEGQRLKWQHNQDRISRDAEAEMDS